MSGKRRSLGAAGERLASEFLAQRGYQIVERNWRFGRSGEIDLVARDGPWLVIVEVRARRGETHGTPEESVTPQKQARLVSLAQAYVDETAWGGPVRIDVVAIHLSPHGHLLGIHHVQDAVEA